MDLKNNANKTSIFLTDRSLEWLGQATELDKKLQEKIYSFSEMFNDMIFDEESVTKQMIACQSKPKDSDEWIDDIVPLPDELTYFSYNCFWFKVDNLDKEYMGCYNSLEKSLIVIPKQLDDDAVILHEMIHLHEDVLNDLPMFFHDTVFWCLYKDLNKRINDLDERIQTHGHILNETSLYHSGGVHDILFLLKSFDLDLRMGYKLGTVFGYGMNE